MPRAMPRPIPRPLAALALAAGAALGRRPVRPPLDACPDGTAIGLGAAGEPWRWTAGPWGVDGRMDDRFEAVFSTTAAPEPATVALLAAGLLAVMPLARRAARRRAHA